MAYDGSLKFDTQISKEGFESGVASLKIAMERLTQAIERLSGQMMNSFKGVGESIGETSVQSEKAASGVDKISDAASTASREAAGLKDQMAAVAQADARTPTQEYLEVTKAVEQARVALDRLLERQAKMDATGVSKDSRTYQNLQYDIDQARNSLIAMQADQRSMQKDGSAYADSLAKARQEVEQMSRISITGLSGTDNAEPTQPPQTALIDPKAMEYDPSAIDFLERYSQSVTEAGKHTNEFQAEISTLETRLKELSSQGMYFGDEEYDEAYMKLARVKQALADYKKEMLSPTPDVEVPIRFDMNSFEGQKQQLRQQLADLESQGISLGSQDYDSIYVALQQVTQAEADYRRSLLQTDLGQQQAMRSADRMSRSLDGVSKSANGTKKAAIPLTKSIFKLGNMFKLMLVRAAMRSLIQGVKEGFQNLAQYSSEFNTTMSGLRSSMMYLKNSFATAFAPILTYVIPALNALINAIATALAWIAQLFAALSGKGTFVRAKKTQEDYAAGLKKTGGAAKQAGKDAQKALAPFDQLTMLQQQSNSGSGGGSDNIVDPSEMFETVEVSSQLANVLDLIKAKLKDLAVIFREGFEIGLGDPTSRLKTIKEGLILIRQSLKEIFSDSDVQDASKRWMETTLRNLGVIAGSVASIGLTIGANIVGGLAIYLEEAKDRIKQYLINMLDISGDTSTIAANFIAVIAEIFSVFAGENGQLFTANIIGLFAEGFMGATELAAKWGRDILDALLTPIINNKDGFKQAFDGLLKIGSQVMGDLKDTISKAFLDMNKSYDEHVKPMFDLFAEGFTQIWNVALEAFNTHILPSLQRVADKFTEFNNVHLQPLMQKFAEFGGIVADTVKVIWEKALLPFFVWAIQTFGPQIGTTIDLLGTIFQGLLTVVADVMSGLLTSLGGVLEFIQGVFTGDIDKALNGVKDVFKGVFNGITSIVETAVNWIIKALNQISFDVPDWIPGLGGNHFGFSLQEIRIPRLATGAVVPPRAGEFAAILGDNNRETEVVSPLSTMKQAFMEAMSEAGNMGKSNDTPVLLELDGEIILQTTVERNKRQWQRTGRNVLI